MIEQWFYDTFLGEHFGIWCYLFVILLLFTIAGIFGFICFLSHQKRKTIAFEYECKKDFIKYEYKLYSKKGNSK